ncbi:MAG: PSD1 and planctomycete cytochrome C domain-containing protein [Acidobacteria bacterium]|nr:PSD1 and planctomycete cytochrome C domain-containing protein [Acidobacteriota bacterium]
MGRNWLLAAGLVSLLVRPAFGDVDFQQDVEPIFHKNCYTCHGPSMQMNGLRLDQRGPALAGGHSGAAIVPSNSDASLLIRRVASDDDKLKMPPGDARLSSADIAALRAWIDAGAEWPEETSAPEKKVASDPSKHWSFQPIQRPEPPRVTQSAKARNAIDQFILAKLESEGVTPSPEADNVTLIRRLSLDLTGLPPSPAEVDAFLADGSPHAYEKVVDRLLDSPHYGERWARHWLDLARYADSDGFEKDLDRPDSWRWRHWVIDALNNDMPFDQFTIEQIAGDLLPNSTTSQKVATGFHRNTLKNREAGVKRGDARFEELIDRANTFGTVWLGLTVGCAQCHDHKFDPISQKEYYQLFAFFDAAKETEVLAPLPGELGPYLQALPEYLRKRQELLEKFKISSLQSKWEEKIVRAMDFPGESNDWDFQITSMRAMFDHADRRLHTPPEQRTETERRLITDYFIRSFGPDLAKDECAVEALGVLRGKLNELEKALPRPSEAYALEAFPEPVTTHIAVRGDWQRPGVAVEPGVLAVLPALPGKEEAPRLQLARWLVDAKNPLIARVSVNRMWQEFFGTGLVATPGDFGAQGEAPSHPELLDWLASEFQRLDWSMKQMHKRIVMSATYRQSSKARQELLTRDPANRLLARQSRLRLSAEQIRDAALVASGLLYPKIGGPSIRPVQPEGIAEVTYGSSKWNASEGKDRYRRGLYIQYKRTAPYPMLANFDTPSSSVSAPQRRRSNTPLQALNLLNDPVFFEAAQALAVRVLQEAPSSANDRLVYAFRLCLAREPDAQDKDRLQTFWQKQKSLFENDPEAAKAASPYNVDGIASAEMAAWVAVGRGLMNLDEFITRE